MFFYCRLYHKQQSQQQNRNCQQGNHRKITTAPFFGTLLHLPHLLHSINICASSIPLRGFFLHSPPVPFLRLIFVVLLLLQQDVSARRCYSCSGQCLAGAPCNCQMGSCQADHCFTDKQPSGVPGVFRLSKGCMRRPARTRSGCDFDHYADHVLCLCSGPGDFCNDHILMRVNTALWRNVTCRNCPDGRPDCGQTCQGQWCHQKTSTGASGCGFGPPALPYHYQSVELLLRQHPKVCISMSRSGGTTSIGNILRPQRFCICLGHLCNEPDPSLMTTAGGTMMRMGANGGGGGNTKHGSPQQQQQNVFSALMHSLMSNAIGGSGGGTNGRSDTTNFGGGSVDVQRRQRQQQQQTRNQRQWELTTLSRAEQSHRQQQFFDCVSCDLSSDDMAATTSNCRQNRCRGQFCVYAAQRVFIGGAVGAGSFSTMTNGGDKGLAGRGGGNGAVLHANGQETGSGGGGIGGTMMYERQGCINVTEPAFVQMGCTHKWVQNELEEIYCACRGQLCNVDLATASASSAIGNVRAQSSRMPYWLCWLSSLAVLLRHHLFTVPSLL